MSTQSQAPDATLTLTNGTLQVHGKGKIATRFNKEMIWRIFELSPHRFLQWMTRTPTLAASDILRALTPKSYESFLEVIHSDPVLTEQYEFKVKNFAAYAHPQTGEWPDEDNLLVLEYIPIDLPYLLSLTWMLDGRLLAGVLDHYTGRIYTLTEEEFRTAYGKSIQDYVAPLLPASVEKSNRAMELLAVPKPKKCSVSFINQKESVEKKTMVVWLDDQIERYLQQHELSFIGTDIIDDQGNK